ncbi:hypothetical protein HYALB_00002896, partial [Hymenoscyphus albidus]
MLSLPTTMATLVLLLTNLTPTHAQQAADGVIVPFTSQLPVCASKCGPLYDVQGGCTDPANANTCFCADARLVSFNTGGTAAVSSVCGPTSCTTPEDLEKVRTWYTGYCANGGNRQATPADPTAPGAAPGATAGTGSTTAGSDVTNGLGSRPSSGTGEGRTWLEGHWKWVIMLVILVVAIVGGWIGACIWRRAYLRKREREFELRPPVIPFAPSQEHHIPSLQGTPSGLQAVYGPGVGMGAGGHLKELRSASTVVDTPSQPSVR